MDSFDAIRHLETKLRDLDLKVEEEMEFQVADLREQEEDLRIAWLSRHILQKAVEDEIQEELVKGRKTVVDAFSKYGEAAFMMGGSYRHADLMVEFKTVKEMQSGNPSEQPQVFFIFGMGGIGYGLPKDL
ncbi:PREDICTED: uncharacterized protein LOC109185342 [Ipomoea nil]|uniref:uncharacterized protein LOC109185342 n=1 Tax=Ipomoea nil TaxID=35883 RepID=UPI000900BAC6|nr:PREDICTED: uncharacterized protein LOC109185342 [Ipomoea nil]XP_019190864.1 PREDICTED: uncharacterized protein LOC109185342 [Ipomoea nil]XP_019190865.1 PREDICTED: uncharacterized protein LOC109185342 [Ipomoea nil]